jgi:hypothetical protein
MKTAKQVREGWDEAFERAFDLESEKTWINMYLEGTITIEELEKRLDYRGTFRLTRTYSNSICKQST